MTTFPALALQFGFEPAQFCFDDLFNSLPEPREHFADRHLKQYFVSNGMPERRQVTGALMTGNYAAIPAAHDGRHLALAQAGPSPMVPQIIVKLLAVHSDEIYGVSTFFQNRKPASAQQGAQRCAGNKVIGLMPTFLTGYRHGPLNRGRASY